jgi:hypothetical protein
MNVLNCKNSQEFNDYLNNKEEQKRYDKNRPMKINSSRMFKEDVDNPSPTRQLRAGSFASFQGFAEDSESGANNSLYGDTAYIETSRDKLRITPEDRKGYETRYQAKLSCITDTFNGDQYEHSPIINRSDLSKFLIIKYA